MTCLRSYRTLNLMLLGSALALAPATCRAQTPTVKRTPAPAASTTVPVVMLSDLHFDPFHDPAKFDRLRAAPAEQWQKILAEPDSPTITEDIAKLNAKCRSRGVDTPWTLLESSLAAAHAESPHALFVTVSGDLLAHLFDCRFNALATKPAEGDYSAFAAKTLAYVAAEMHRTFGKTPVYLALGNNDSGCGDYRESSNSPFLKNAAESFAEDVASTDAMKDILTVFPDSGSYTVALPAPVVKGRLIVLQDLFLARTYAGCNGKPDTAAAAAQLDWLRQQLSTAHAAHEQVWVMAHIPPGLDLYSTTTGNRDVCGGQAPVMFLHDEKLVDVLTDFAPDIRLAIFAHTHNDEMRLFQSADGSALVAGKLVPSISPINGNYPAFTLAEVDPKTAILKDFRVLASDSKTGVAAKWAQTYKFSTAYHASAYTPATLATILKTFRADAQSEKPESNAFEQNFMVNGGLRSLAIRLVWPQYVCMMQNNTPAAYKTCICPVPSAGTPAP